MKIEDVEKIRGYQQALDWLLSTPADAILLWFITVRIFLHVNRNNASVNSSILLC
jgi:hypothetical protein